MNEQQLTEAIQQLPRALPPERDLWPQLASRLTAQPQLATSGDTPGSHKRLGRWGWASVAVVAMLGLMYWQLALTPLAPVKQASALSAEVQLLLQYEQQKSLQLSQVVAVAEGFDNWQQQLQIWDQAILQVRQALQFYPDEPHLLAQLQQLYQQQLDYIQRATVQQPLIMS